MANNENDKKILKSLTEEEIEVIVRNMDIDQWLKEIKRNEASATSKYIMCQIKGKLKSNSKEVQEKFPGAIAESIVSRNDSNCAEQLMSEFSHLRDGLTRFLHEDLKDKYSMKQFASFSAADYRLFLEDLIERNLDFIPELFFVQLKINGEIVAPEMEQAVIQMWGYGKTLKEALNRQKDEYRKLDDKYKELGNRYRETDKENEKLKARLNELETSNKRLSANLSQEKEAFKKNLEIEYAELVERNESLKKEEKDATEHIRKLEDELVKLQSIPKSDAYQKLEGKYQKEVEDNKILYRNNEKLLQENKKLTQHIQAFDDTLAQKQAEVDEQERHVQELTEKLKQMMTEKEKTSDTQPARISVEGNLRENNLLFIQRFAQPGEDDIVSIMSTTGYISYVNAQMQDFVYTEGRKEWRKKLRNICEYFVYSRLLGLHPIFCGYGSLTVASALIALMDGEKAEVITIEPGFNDVASLDYAIQHAGTKNVIIADGFGRMNEDVLMPILRKRYDKKLAFIAESPEEIAYTPRYIMRYCLLIAFEGWRWEKEYRFSYARIDEGMLMWDKNPDGHKAFDEALAVLNLDPAYLSTRRGLFDYAMSKENNNSDFKAAFQQYAVNELFWLLDEAGRKQLQDYMMQNAMDDEVLNGIF
ncbi:hypothetical protein ACQRAB_11165 [Megasphaera elsdenii]|uniref:hypothetical protein n=1 Tax=Megasphaera elsdenii TaxID=907 RepID=UPI003D07AAF5